MEVDEPSVSSRSCSSAIHVADPVSSTPRDSLTRASKRLEDLTSHGLTRGTLQIRTSPQEMCGVVGSVQWVWVAQALGFSPIWFVPKDPESERIASALWPTLQLSLSASRVFGERPVPLVFSSKRIDNTIWHHPSLRWLVSSTTQRPSAPLWSESRLKVQHSLVHGITDGSAIVCLFGLTQTWDSCAVPAHAHSLPRDVYSVVSDHLIEGRPAPRPNVTTFEKPRVHVIGNNAFHGGGLFPRSASRPRFLIPSTRSRTKWCVRTLTREERLLVDDVPQVVVDSLPVALHGLLAARLVPGLCLVQGTIGLLVAQGLLVKGGGRDILVPSRVWGHDRPPLLNKMSEKSSEKETEKERKKEEKKEEAKKEEEKWVQKDETLPTEEKEEEKLVQKDATLPPEELGDPKARVEEGAVCLNVEELLEESLEGSKTPQFRLDGCVDGLICETVHDKDGPAMQVRKDDGFASSQELPSPPEKESEDMADRVARLMKATKSDEAPVPEYIWNEAVLRGISFTPQQEAATWPKALNGFRTWMLCWWKRNLQQDFHRWTRDRSDDWKGAQVVTRRIDQSEVLDGDDLDGDEVMEDNTISTNQDVVDTVEVPIRYVWTQEGRRWYQMWWRWRHKAHKVSISAARDGIGRAMETTWWEWTDGSTPFFWRWPAFYLETIRDGLRVWFDDKEVPCNKLPQRREHDEDVRRKMRGKLKIVRGRRYITRGVVRSLTSYFSVPKGLEDVRMVYDGTASGLNDAIWVPRFSLPTAATHLRALDAGYQMADVDIGEMFLNFVLHESMQSLCGVDLSDLFTDEMGGKKVLWERWVRCAMGLKSSPYQAVQAVMVAEEVIKGDRLDPDNVFRWDVVRLNLPGSEDYDPTLPWVSKVRMSDGKIAADLFIYVDDARSTGSNYEESRMAARRTASTFNYLGIQDAARKRREPSEEPGAWAGTVLSTADGVVGVRVSKEKWDKAKNLVNDTYQEVLSGKRLTMKTLLQRRGFLQYVTRTYPAMVPYMKGFHNTIDSWRANRDDDGWKLRPKKKRRLNRPRGKKLDCHEDMHDVEFQVVEIEAAQDECAPETVSPVGRFVDDLKALIELFSATDPPLRVVRSNKRFEAQYGFGDASKSGFGATIQIGEDIKYVYGQWCDDMMEESSNYRELNNLVKTMKDMVEDGTLKGCEVFLFTDNSTAEAVFLKGNSTSRGLFDAMLELRKLEMQGELLLHLIHVSGKRMIEQGTDGTSRGDHSQGVMKGESMLQHVPLNLGAHVRSSGLIDWLKSWWPERECGNLQLHVNPEDWFTTAHSEGAHAWFPAPAAADVVAEELSRALHKRRSSYHLVFVPRLFTSRWRRLLGRESDLCIEIPVGVPDVWPEDMHEPLFLFVTLPLCRVRPWSMRSTPFVEEFRGLLRKLWTSDSIRHRDLLRKLFIRTSALGSMSESVVRGVLHSPQWRPIPDSKTCRR